MSDEKKNEFEDLEVEATEAEDVQGGGVIGINAMQGQGVSTQQSAEDLARQQQIMAAQQAAANAAKGGKTPDAMLNKLKGFTGSGR